jgi:hypothetical protein
VRKSQPVVELSLETLQTIKASGKTLKHMPGPRESLYYTTRRKTLSKALEALEPEGDDEVKCWPFAILVSCSMLVNQMLDRDTSYTANIRAIQKYEPYRRTVIRAIQKTYEL